MFSGAYEQLRMDPSRETAEDMKNDDVEYWCRSLVHAISVNMPPQTHICIPRAFVVSG